MKQTPYVVPQGRRITQQDVEEYLSRFLNRRQIKVYLECKESLLGNRNAFEYVEYMKSTGNMNGWREVLFLYMKCNGN